MTDKLTDNDKERIKALFHQAFPYSSGSGVNEFFVGYEIATAFERQKVKELEAERSELIEYNNNLEKTLRICLTVKPHTESVDAMKAMVKTLLENSLKTK